MSLKSKALYGVAWSIFDKLVNHLGSFLLLIYLSRVLTPSDFGLIAMLAVFLAVAQSLTDSGFSQALIQKSNSATEDDFSTVFYVNLILSSSLYLLLYISAPTIADFYSSPVLVDLSRILFIIVIIDAIALVPRSKLAIVLDFKTLGLVNSVSTIISALVAIIMVNSGLGYWSLVGLSLTKSIITSLLLVIVTRWCPKLKFSRVSFSSLFSFSSNLLIAGTVARIVQNLYAVMIGRYFNATQAGYFQQAFSYTEMLSSAVTSVTQGVSYPLMTSIKDDRDRLIGIYKKVMGVITFVAFPVFIGFAAVAEEFVLILLGEKWKEVIPILMVMSLSRLFTPISSLNLGILNASGRSDLFLKTDLSKVPMVVGALFIAIPYGIFWVACAHLTTTFISFFINAYYPGKMFGFGALKQIKQMLPIAGISVVMFFSIYFIKFDNLLFQFIIKIIVGIFIFVLFCLIFKPAAFIDIRSLLGGGNKSGRGLV
ncbi:polysaccharide biosynthesis protein [Shewanella pealeana ATCC 700345]|uniref:Polysaccharide biosynthesis protein n=1 Tax=Shewanella pealeana (strain ATCC 700345 / ANG-SQ1) TaxID=398579 RepID=A8H2E7_SHEPA|nr:lipopolysaccharide biosynthesis protein [Shewanella pealeana]ABV86734.1 polysaccharide biosynthesis protein [Shewanella pealeana ATCC 700345]